MDDESSRPFRLRELVTRFVCPFFFDRLKVGEARAALERETIPREGQSFQVWECATPHDLYREELLEHVVKFLFGVPPEAERAECGYLRISSPVAAIWFNKLEAVMSPGAPDGERQNQTRKVRVRLLPREGVELFLSKYGVGVMSVALAIQDENVSASAALEFNYRLSQGRDRTAGRLRVPHPADHPERWARLSAEDKARVAPAPAEDAPLAQQLGRAGGSFTLYRLARELLRPLDALCLRPVQEELSVYTVARFGEEADLASEEACAQVAPFLSALAQIEEPGHAGAPPGALSLANALLNRRHWAAVGLLGAAHVVADQPPPGSAFNAARVPRVLLKYYVPYLLALLQRLALHRIIDEAFGVVLAPDAASGRLETLRKHLLEFAVKGYFTEVSNREALHRYYRLCQQGLDVHQALNDTRQAIADLDAKHAAENQARIAEETAQSAAATRDLQQEMVRNVAATRELQQRMTEHLGVVARVQVMVELFEVFVVAVAAAELWHTFSSENQSWFPRWAARLFRGSRGRFVAWGALAAAFLAGGLVLAAIRWRRRKRDGVESGSRQTG